MRASAAIDASMWGTASVAAAAGERRSSLEVDEGPAESLATAFREVLGLVDLRAADVAELIIGIGPGSFTGVRTAVAFANSVAYATGCTLRTVTGLEAIACEYSARGETVAVAMDAGRGRIHVAAYRQDDGASRVVIPPATIEPEDFGSFAAGVQVERVVALDGVASLDLPDGLPLAQPPRRGPDAALYLRLGQSRPWIAPEAPAGGAAAVYLGSALRQNAG